MNQPYQNGTNWGPFSACLLAIGLEIGIIEAILLYLRFFKGLNVENLMEEMQAYVGPVFVCYLFMAFLGILIFSTLLLIFDLLDIYCADADLHLSLLDYIKGASPLIGILVTFISLREIQIDLDLALNQKELFTLLAVNTGKAFGSTIIGLMLSFLAVSVKSFYTTLQKEESGEY